MLVAHVLEVEVFDPGPPRRTHQVPSLGVGLRIMADRLASVGGTLEAGRTSGGFSTRAVLRLEDSST